MAGSAIRKGVALRSLAEDRKAGGPQGIAFQKSAVALFARCYTLKPMPTQSCSVLEVADFYAQRKEEVIAQWQCETSDLLQRLNLDQPVIRDHVPQIVDLIIWDLRTSRDGTKSTENHPTSPATHGSQRFRDGLDIGEVVTEFNLLRAAFATVAEQHQLLIPGEAMRIINFRIDAAVRTAVTAFAQAQSELRLSETDDHLAFLAHDLRTPLNAVSLLIQELSMSLDPAFAAENAETLECLKRNLDRVEDLIKRVLVAHADTPGNGATFRPVFRQFELWPLVQRLVSDFKSVAAEHEITVINAIPRSIRVDADAGLVSQVFQNLLANAFKYARAGQVIITAVEKDDRIACCVRDNGSGIAPELVETIFDKHATDPHNPSTGLGLALSKQIVQLHRGMISVESLPGSGTSFCFTLPLPP